MKHHGKNIRTFGGHRPQLGERVFVDPTAVVLGDASLGDDVSVWPQVAIRADMHTITIGARTSVQDGCVLHITHAGPYNDGGWTALFEAANSGHVDTVRLLIKHGALATVTDTSGQMPVYYAQQKGYRQVVDLLE